MFVLAGAFSAKDAVADTRPDEVEDRVEYFQLFTNCAPLNVMIGVEVSKDSMLKLDQSALQAAVESRLRAARIYGNAAIVPALIIGIDVVGRAFVTHVILKKDVTDTTTGIRDMATTWRDGVVGTHGDNAQIVVSSLSGAIDRFLVEYLRVNEAACPGR